MCLDFRVCFHLLFSPLISAASSPSICSLSEVCLKVESSSLLCVRLSGVQRLALQLVFVLPMLCNSTGSRMASKGLCFYLCCLWDPNQGHVLRGRGGESPRCTYCGYCSLLSGLFHVLIQQQSTFPRLCYWLHTTWQFYILPETWNIYFLVRVIHCTVSGGSTTTYSLKHLSPSSRILAYSPSYLSHWIFTSPHSSPHLTRWWCPSGKEQEFQTSAFMLPVILAGCPHIF